MGGGDDVTTVLRFQFSCSGGKVTLEARCPNCSLNVSQSRFAPLEGGASCGIRVSMLVQSHVNCVVAGSVCGRTRANVPTFVVGRA